MFYCFMLCQSGKKQSPGSDIRMYTCTVSKYCWMCITHGIPWIKQKLPVLAWMNLLYPRAQGNYMEQVPSEKAKGKKTHV